MAVQNRIVKVQKRNRALVHFDQSLIVRAVLRAAQSIGGFRADYLPGINHSIFDAHPTDERLAEFISEVVVLCLNADPHHLISNFPPTIEAIQDQVLHALSSFGFQNTSDAFACYRWGRHWLREGAITQDQFAGNGTPSEAIERSLERNRARGCDTVTGLNEIVRSNRLKVLVEDSTAVYEQSLDAAAARFMTRCAAGDRIRIIWVTGPSCSGKTTTTVKLTQRLAKQGLKFVALNLDDYFWSVVEHPTDWINDRNYETPEALDIQLVNRHLRELLDGKRVERPVFSFKEGRRTGTVPLQLEPDQVLLLDCLHGAYPPLAEGIEPSAQFRLYIEARNAIFEGDGTGRRLVRGSDVRLMRRMLRDTRHRNYSPLRTLLHWHYVRDGELFSILPLRGLADHVVNGGFPFDLAVMRPFLAGNDGLLPAVEELQPYNGFLDARIRFERIRRLMEGVEGIEAKAVADHGLIPGDALVREFIGGGALQIPHND